jgi:hypothetical protein
VTTIHQRLSTGRGEFTTDYPELGTAPVNYEDSISEEFFADAAPGPLRHKAASSTAALSDLCAI